VIDDKDYIGTIQGAKSGTCTLKILICLYPQVQVLHEGQQANKEGVHS